MLEIWGLGTPLAAPMALVRHFEVARGSQQAYVNLESISATKEALGL